MTPGNIPLEEAGFIERRRKARRGKAGNSEAIFAVTALPRAALVFRGWHEEFYKGLVGWDKFTVEQIQAMPSARKRLVLRYGLDIGFGTVVAPLEARFVTSLDNFLNHSCEPNLGYDLEGNVITTREIAANEELTIDYGCFAVNFDEPWQCRCGTPSCRKRIRNTDWKELARRHGLAMPRFLHPRIVASVVPPLNPFPVSGK